MDAIESSSPLGLTFSRNEVLRNPFGLYMRKSADNTAYSIKRWVTIRTSRQILFIGFSDLSLEGTDGSYNGNTPRAPKYSPATAAGAIYNCWK